MNREDTAPGQSDETGASHTNYSMKRKDETIELTPEDLRGCKIAQ